MTPLPSVSAMPAVIKYVPRSDGRIKRPYVGSRPASELRCWANGDVEPSYGPSHKKCPIGKHK